jgi:hypothetical protein
MKFLFTLLPLLMAPDAYCDDLDSSTQPTIIYKKKTSVSFDDAIVEGNPHNPEGVYVVTPPEKKFGSLLKLRPNFHRELVRDSLLLK